VPAPPPGDNTCAFEEAWLVQPLPLPEAHKGPGFLLLVAGEQPALPAGIPIEMVDLTREPKDRAAAFALFRRYLFDYRAGLTLPFLVLLDEHGHAAKVYPSLPPASKLRQDLEAVKSPDRLSLALPFPGFYASTPSRNYFRLGAAFFWAGYPEQALQYLSQVLLENPANFKAQLAVGQIHLGAGRLEEAEARLEKALALNSESPEVWNNLGILDTNRSDYREALAKFEKALAIRPDSPYALANAAQAQARLGDLPGAETRFRLALQLDPNDAETTNQLGLLLAKTGRVAEARDLFQRVITIRRDHAAAINNLGVLYMQMQKPDDALAAFLYGVKEAPDDETLRLNLARVYAGRGEAEKARETLLQFLGRQPGSDLARKALEQLSAR
jgi:Flp pilus assembly protein TadD